MLQRDDIVMCMSSGSAHVVGKSASLNRDWMGSFGAFCAAVRTNSTKADAGFVAHILAGASFRQWASTAQGNNIKNLNKSALEGYPIFLPPVDEQRRIVALLDRAVEIRRRAEAARAKARAIIPALFLDTFGDPATNPKRWPIMTVGGLQRVELRNGVSPSRTGKVDGKVLTLSAITRGSFDTSAVKEGTFAEPLSEQQSVSRTLFLICRGNGNRDLVGQGAYPTLDMPGVAFPDTMIALRTMETEIAPEFLSAVWSSDRVRGQIYAAAKTTNGTFKISQSSIARFSFPLPPLARQRAFAEHIQRVLALARNLDAAVAKAEAMAAALSAEVFG
jgi:type I restriction enzyme, S subunit